MTFTILVSKAGETEVSKGGLRKGDRVHKQGQPRPGRFPGLGGQLGPSQSLAGNRGHREPGPRLVALSLFPY